jgi:uncharacterized protein YodC (DUF2158 family)
MHHKAVFGASHLIVVKRVRTRRHVTVGAFVRLNSGGPVGTVTGLSSDQVRVRWLAQPCVTSTLPQICLSMAGAAE